MRSMFGAGLLASVLAVGFYLAFIALVVWVVASVVKAVFN